MIPHHVYYQLAVVGLLWLCVMLHYVWSSRVAVSLQPPAEPVPSKFKRKPSNEPKPFEGLTQKPQCAACEHDANHPMPPAPRRPDPMPPTNRRPRVIDTSRHFCPHAGCDYRGWLGLGNLRANGHPSGEQTAVGDRYRPSHPGDGAACRASRGPGAGVRLCPAVPDGWLQGVCDGATDALWAVGAA